jgi:peptidoglycan/xylan/chitin deacetylase (PgdA/CDA1 family)
MTSSGAATGHPLAGLLTVMWHYVRDAATEPHVGATWVEPATFDRQLDLIGRHRTVVTWKAVAAALRGGPALPPKPALLTFDDGLADHARTVTPRLLDRGWSGVFFVLARQPGERLTVGHAIHILLADLGEDGLATAIEDALEPSPRRRLVAARKREASSGVEGIDVLKRPLQRDLADDVAPILSRLVETCRGPEADLADALHLSPGDLAWMRGAGLTIGGHGRRHLWFDHEPAARVVAEVEASAAFLAAEPGPRPFAYPYGASSRAAIAALAEHAFASAFHASPRTARGPFDLGRVDAEDPSFEAVVAGSGAS